VKLAAPRESSPLLEARQRLALAACQLDEADGALMRATLDAVPVAASWQPRLDQVASSVRDAAGAVALLGARYEAAASDLHGDAADVAAFAVELGRAAATGDHFGPAHPDWGRRLAPASFGARFVLGLLGQEQQD
jgi:hypothetical protein